MRFLLLSHIEHARQSLRAHRMRSRLTMVGVAIGVASITAILSLGAGASGIVSQQVDELGGVVAVIRPLDSNQSALSGLTQLQSPNNFAISSLTMQDVGSVSAIDHVSAVAPIAVMSGLVKGDSPAGPETKIVATTPALATVNNLNVRVGEFLNDELRSDTAVIGSQASVDLFGTEESIGKSVTIKDVRYTIVGVLDRINQPINYNNIDFDNAVFISIDSVSELLSSSVQIQQINLQSDSVASLQSVVVASQKVLLVNHLDQADFQILTGDQISQPTSQLFYAIAGVTTAIAGISLLVGGIGIMNIMLVSVTERTREIGIRKALGASSSDIVWQFMIESLALSAGGGIIGFLLGYGLAFAVSLSLTFDPAFRWEILAVSLSLSVIVGLVFGLYPAIRAAMKDPISALRQYD